MSVPGWSGLPNPGERIRRFSIRNSSCLLLQIAAAVIVCLLPGMQWLAPSSAVAAGKPNVLFIVSDDHSVDVLGAYGSRLARTPNLDRLAGEGVRFDRAFCNAPICSPSRQSFLTGRYAHAVGVTLLTHALDDEPYTLAELLRDAGYRTAAFGKMHFNSPRLHGFEIHRTRADWAARDQEQPRRPLPEGVEVLPAWRPFDDPAQIWLNAMYVPFGRYDDQMHGTWYAQEAIEFMGARRDKPFFVQIGFEEPHSPFWFPVEMRGMYDPARLPVPDLGPEDAGQIPRVFADLTREQKQGIIASYYTSVAFLDRNVGRVLAALEELGLRDNTMVIYAGDNGYHLGEHGRFEKHSLLERSVLVPLMMRLPGRIPAGSSTDALVELVDIFPTVLDYLDLPIVPPSVQATTGETPVSQLRDLQGHSLRPLIEGRVPAVRDAAFAEYRHTEEAMVRTHRYKLIYRTSKGVTDWYEPVEALPGRNIRLFDLQNDPEELRNVSGDPANAVVVAELLDRLVSFYRGIPPRGEVPPVNLEGMDFLDWAIAQRNAP
jgi:choline-sulfatase